MGAPSGIRKIGFISLSPQKSSTSFFLVTFFQVYESSPVCDFLKRSFSSQSSKRVFYSYLFTHHSISFKRAHFFKGRIENTEEKINKVEEAPVECFAVSNLLQLGYFSNLHKDLLSSWLQSCRKWMGYKVHEDNLIKWAFFAYEIFEERNH